MVKNSLKDALWIFSHPNPSIIPSYLVSGIMPANILEVKKLIYSPTDEPKKIIRHFRPKVLIISKVFHNKVFDLVKIAKKEGIKIISIFDDWNFDKESKTDKTSVNLPLAKISNLIIVKTKAASIVLKENTNLKSSIIPDMVRFKMAPPSTKIDSPINLIWFGMHSNHDSLFQELQNINNLGFKVNLKVVTNFSNEFKSLLVINYKNIKFKIIEWQTDFYKEIISSNVVIIPYPKDKERLVKSSNRIIDSINLGKFVILSDVKQFIEFKEFSYYGDIAQGLKWLKYNTDKIEIIVKNAQNHVSKNYSQEAVSNLWKKTIEEV